MKKSAFLLAGLIISSQVAFAADDDKLLIQKNPPAKESLVTSTRSDSGFRVGGPSLHLSGGIRMKKAPDLDTFESAVGGIKLSPLSLFFGGSTYLSLLAPGVNYVRDNRIAASLSPIMFNHMSGLGFSFDFYSVRDDRQGGPWGFSLNLDVLRLGAYIRGE